MLEYYKRGDVVFIPGEYNANHVESGSRPWVIVSNNQANRVSPVLLCVPLTTNLSRPDIPSHLVIQPPFLRAPSCILGENLQCKNRKDTWVYLGRLDTDDLAAVDYSIHQALYYTK